MNITHRLVTIAASLATATVLLQACERAPEAASRPQHIRGTIESRDGQFLTIATPTGPVTVQLGSSTQVATVADAARSRITDGDFVSIASTTHADGSQRAVEVTIYPESLRGTGEGHYDWDIPAAADESMMNGVASKITSGTGARWTMTTGTVSLQAGESTLTVRYGDGASGGSQRLELPRDVPVVILTPGQIADVEAGEQVFVIVHRDAEGVMMADDVLAGRDGVVPPM